MKKLILTILAVFVFSVALSAQSLKTPSIHFEKTEVDFKQVPPDSLLRHTFVFKNTGSDTLSILNVRPG